jgi:hypothetical protein
MLKQIVLNVDDLDLQAIQDAIAHYEAIHIKNFGEVILPDGDSEQPGAIIAELCRGYLERAGVLKVTK